MKKTWLIPLLLTSTSLPLVSITGCNKDNNGLVAIPEDYLEIASIMGTDDHILEGFDSQHQTAISLKGYNKLTIPKNISYMSDAAFAYTGDDNDAPLVIKQVDFEANCKCTSFGATAFGSCINLETVIFPPKYHPTDKGPFANCINLKILDFSNMTENIKRTQVENDFFKGLPDNGYFICKESQTCISEFLKIVMVKLAAEKGWQPIVK